MFFIKIFYFLKGYVIIEAEGLFTERFINICIRHDIHFLSLEKKNKNCLVIKIPRTDFKKIRYPARKTHTRVRILKKSGLVEFLKNQRGRYAFFSGAAAFVLFFGISSMFVWSVETEGTDNITPAVLTEALRDEGIYPGAFKGKIKKPREIKEALMRRFDNISWAWAYSEGSRITVKIKEGTIPPFVADKNKPCSIVAARDGIVKSITAKNGEKAVREGDAVMTGDVLISGEYTLPKGELRKTHAEGEISAYTWHEKTGEYSLVREHRTETGRKKTGYTLEIFSKSFNLKSGKHDFAEYETEEKTYELKLGKDYYLGIGLIRRTFSEIEKNEEQIPYDTAAEEAREDLEQKISEELLPGAVKCESEFSVKNIDDRTIEATLTMGFIEKIGTQITLDEE